MSYEPAKCRFYGAKGEKFEIKVYFVHLSAASG